MIKVRSYSIARARIYSLMSILIWTTIMRTVAILFSVPIICQYRIFCLLMKHPMPIKLSQHLTSCQVKLNLLCLRLHAPRLRQYLIEAFLHPVSQTPALPLRICRYLMTSPQGISRYPEPQLWPVKNVRGSLPPRAFLSVTWKPIRGLHAPKAAQRALHRRKIVGATMPPFMGIKSSNAQNVIIWAEKTTWRDTWRYMKADQLKTWTSDKPKTCRLRNRVLQWKGRVWKISLLFIRKNWKCYSSFVELFCFVLFWRGKGLSWTWMIIPRETAMVDGSRPLFCFFLCSHVVSCCNWVSCILRRLHLLAPYWI